MKQKWEGKNNQRLRTSGKQKYDKNKNAVKGLEDKDVESSQIQNK